MKAGDGAHGWVLTVYAPRQGKKKAALELFALVGKRSTKELLSIPLIELEIIGDDALGPDDIQSMSNIMDWKDHAVKHHGVDIPTVESENKPPQEPGPETPNRPRRKKKPVNRLTSAPPAPKRSRKTKTAPMYVESLVLDPDRTDSDSDKGTPAHKQKKGKKGDKGDKGAKGEKGDVGPAGPPRKALSTASVTPATPAEWMKHTETLMEKMMDKMTGLVEASVGKGKYNLEEMAALAKLFTKN